MPPLLRLLFIIATSAAFTTSAIIASPAYSENHAATILTVVRAGVDPVELSLEGLDALDQSTINTANEFVDGTAAFSGPLARTLLSLVDGTAGNSVILTAANDYSITLEASDFFDYDVVMATRVNGEVLSPRDKGPIWLMYPISDHSELQDSVVNSKLIWQLVRLEVQ